jgi:hypothetical protein
MAAMARAARAHWWPMRGKVDSTSTKGVRGTRRARRSVPQLTEVVGRQRGGRVGDKWWHSGGGGRLVRASGDLASSL